MFRRFFKSTSPLRPSPFGATISYVLLIIWAGVVLFPLYWLVVTSLKLPIQVNEGPFYLPFIDYTPSLHAWQYIFVDLRNDTLRPYMNTVVVALTSSALSLSLGTAAAYGLTRFVYRPKLGSVLVVLGLIALAVVAIGMGVPWQLAVLVAIVLAILAVQTLNRRFQRSLQNQDVAFWLISQRILPPVAVVIPIYVLFQQLGLLDTKT
ncbi:MAG: carbohydrate ABC transporter permease, partial [Caldilineae bacterium]